MKHKIAEFWSRSYRSDKIAFVFELLSFVFTVAASLTLAITAKNPNMLLIYPGAFLGAITQCYAAFRRGTAWVMILTFYFCCVNVFGFGVAANWW